MTWPQHRKLTSQPGLETGMEMTSPLGGYVCLIHALQMWCKIILAALLEIRELYSMKSRIALYGPNSKNTNIAGSHTARRVRPDFVSRLYSCPHQPPSLGAKTLGPCEIE